MNRERSPSRGASPAPPNSKPRSHTTDAVNTTNSEIFSAPAASSSSSHSDLYPNAFEDSISSYHGSTASYHHPPPSPRKSPRHQSSVGNIMSRLKKSAPHLRHHRDSDSRNSTRSEVKATSPSLRPVLNRADTSPLSKFGFMS